MQFAIPRVARPKKVEAAVKRFDDVAIKRASRLGERSDLEEAAQAAKAEGIQAAAAAYADGKEPPNLAAIDQEFATRSSEIATDLRVLDVAVDTVGNELARAVGENAADWIDSLTPIVADAEAEYLGAIDTALAALVRLREARGAVEWLARFDADQARIGAVSQFTGGRIMVRDHKRVEHDPRGLLELAARIEEPGPAPARREPEAVTA